MNDPTPLVWEARTPAGAVLRVSRLAEDVNPDWPRRWLWFMAKPDKGPCAIGYSVTRDQAFGAAERELERPTL